MKGQPSTLPMSRAGSTMAQDQDDLTAELPLPSDEDLLHSPSRWSQRRIVLLATVAAVVVGAAVGLPLWLAGGASPTGLTVTTTTVDVTTGTIQQTVATSGTLEPANEANLNFAVAGVVTAIDVHAGQTVTAGQVLATVGTSALQSEVDGAQAQLAAAQDRLASDQAANAATAQIDSDDAAVTSAESALTTAQTSFTDASLTSTIAGTVASVNLVVGQQVAGTGGSGTGGSGTGGSGTGGSGTGGSGSGSGGSSAAVVVIQTNSFIVNATVDDTQIGQIAEGDQATITPSGSATVDYGTVSSIALIATGTSGIASFPVVINVTGSPSGLYAGSSVGVSIIVKQLNNVVEVPTPVITYGSAGQATVTEVVNGRDVTKDVTVGAAALGETQILSGVQPGDKVLERVFTFKGVPGGGTRGIFGGGGTGGGTGRVFSPGGGFGGGGVTPGGGVGSFGAGG